MFGATATSTPDETVQLPLVLVVDVDGVVKNFNPQWTSVGDEASTVANDEVIVSQRCEQVVEFAAQLLAESIARVIEDERSKTSRRSAGFLSNFTVVAPQLASPVAVEVGFDAAASGAFGMGITAVLIPPPNPPPNPSWPPAAGLLSSPGVPLEPQADSMAQDRQLTVHNAPTMLRILRVMTSPKRV